MKDERGFIDPLSLAVVATLMWAFFIMGKTDQAKAKGLVAGNPAQEVRRESEPTR